MDHVRFEYQFPQLRGRRVARSASASTTTAASCARAACASATRSKAPTPGTWPAAARDARVITDLNQPWGESRRPAPRAANACMACPTGAMFRKGSTVAEMEQRQGETRIPGQRTGEEAMDRLRLATVWLGGCSGCHMSFLDLDEWLIDLAGRSMSSSARSSTSRSIRRTWMSSWSKARSPTRSNLRNDPARSARAPSAGRLRRLRGHRQRDRPAQPARRRPGSACARLSRAGDVNAQFPDEPRDRAGPARSRAAGASRWCRSIFSCPGCPPPARAHQGGACRRCWTARRRYWKATRFEFG